ncbi:hypothetical protein AYO39_00870, partial [Actinobacteria bacterium SCGC AG-212-D09]
MILTAHQPVYLPWLGLFHKISLADKFVSFDRVQYLPKDWNNRNRIKTRNGPMWLTVPVFTRGHRLKNIDEIEIDNRSPWRRKHWLTLEHSYGKAPYFADYSYFFRDVYNREWTYLADLNDEMLRWFLAVLGIDVEFARASDEDFEGAKSALVLDMCRKLGADRYVFGALGRDYADVASFTRAGVEVVFQDYQHPTYPQMYGAFEPYLSIVDLLFNCGAESLEI